MRIISKFRKFKDYLISIILQLIITLWTTREFFSNSLVAGDDTLHFIARIQYYSLSPFELWESIHLGAVVPLNLYNFLAFINSFLMDSNLVIKVLIILMIFFTGIFMYLLAYKITNKNNLTSIIAMFVYSMNIFISSRIASGHFLHVFAYMLTPLIFIFIYKYTKEFKNRYIVLTGISFSLLWLTRFDPILYVSPLLLYPIFVYIFDRKKIRFNRIAKFYLVFLVIFIVLGIFIWLPFKICPPPHVATKFSINDLKYTSFPIIDAFQGSTRALTYIFYLGEISWNTHPFLSYSLYKIILMIIPVFAFSVILFERKNRDTIFFTFLALLSILLITGPRPPLEDLYIFLYKNIPFFSNLRAPMRWGHLLWFSYSILIAIGINRIMTITKNNRKTISILILMAIVSIVLTPIVIGNYYIITKGYLTWQIPSNESRPYELLSKMDGDFRVVSVPYAQPRMFMKGWAEHDLGKESYFISGKSSFYREYGDVDYKDYGRDFYVYTQYIAEYQITKKLSKILGIFDVRYIVIHGYPPTWPYYPIIKEMRALERLSYRQHKFFESLDGLTKIAEFNNNYTLVYSQHEAAFDAFRKQKPELKSIHIIHPTNLYENQYWIPRIFTPSGTILVVGGLDTFQKFAEIDSFNFSNWDLLFADHIVENLGKDELIQQIKKSDYIAFVNSEPLDLAMLLANVTWIKVKTFERDSKGWHEDDWPIIEGYFAYYRDVISAKEKGANAIYKIKIDKDSICEIWIRLFLHDKAGKLKITIDKKPIGEINAYSPQKLGFKWIKAGELKLSKGTHTIEILNVNGENKLNGIIIAKKGEIEHALNYTKQLIQNKSIHLLDIEKVKKIGIDPMKYLKEEVIFDDYWVTKYFWTQSFPENIKIRDSSNKISGITSLRIDVTPRPKPGEVVSKRFYELQNWSGIKYISFWFKGTGKGEEFNLWIYFNNSKWPNPDAVRFGPFYDNSKEWRKIVIPVDKPVAKYGKIMWNKVSRIVLAIPDKNFSGTIYLDRFSIYRGNIDRTKLESVLNAKVLLFKNSKPIENYIIKPNNKCNVTYIEFKRLSPSKWIVYVNSTGPYTLVFSNTYHKMWKAYIDGKEYYSIPSYYFINSFQINETGKHEVVIEFIGQRIQDISLMISGFANLGCFIYLFYDWRREKGDKCALKVEKKIREVLQKVVKR